MTPERYVQYLKAYADTFGLWEYIQCSTTVTSIRPHPTESGHIVELHADGHFQNSFVQGPTHYHVVAICTGLNRVPFLPNIPGLDTSRHLVVAGSDDSHGKPDAWSGSGPVVMHSSAFKSRAQFGKNTTVLILGAGETAMDIAHLAVTDNPGHRVIISHRDGFTHAPKIVPMPYRAGGRKGGPDPDQPNKPLDCAVASLFDTAYVPGFIQSSYLHWLPYDLFVKNMPWLISGTRAGFDQWVAGVGRERFHIDGLLFCKSSRAIPYISEQWRSKSTFNKWRTWLINMELKPTGGRKIDMAPWPSHFDQDGVVHFHKTNRPESNKMNQEKGIRPDVVIFATGYKRSFPFLPQDDECYPSLEACTTRGIYRNIDDGVAYIGFVRPSFGRLQIRLPPLPQRITSHKRALTHIKTGAIPPLAELQAQRWIHALALSPKYQPYFSSTFSAPPSPPRRSPAAVAPYELKCRLSFRGPPEDRAAHDFAATKCGVDHESYAYQLAVDMGSAPTAWHVWRAYGAGVFFTWAMGPNFPTKFRLLGPWSSPKTAAAAAAVMEWDGELGKVVRRTGGGVCEFEPDNCPPPLFFAFPLLPSGLFLVRVLIRFWQFFSLTPSSRFWCLLLPVCSSTC